MTQLKLDQTFFKTNKLQTMDIGLSANDLTVEYRQGKENCDADSLSKSLSR